MAEPLCSGCAAEAAWEGAALTVRHESGCIEALALAPVGGDE